MSRNSCRFQIRFGNRSLWCVRLRLLRPAVFSEPEGRLFQPITSKTICYNHFVHLFTVQIRRYVFLNWSVTSNNYSAVSLAIHCHFLVKHLQTSGFSLFSKNLPKPKSFLVFFLVTQSVKEHLTTFQLSNKFPKTGFFHLSTHNSQKSFRRFSKFYCGVSRNIFAVTIFRLILLDVNFKSRNSCGFQIWFRNRNSFLLSLPIDSTV
jgi:hypothetical protein